MRWINKYVLRYDNKGEGRDFGIEVMYLLVYGVYGDPEYFVRRGK